MSLIKSSARNLAILTLLVSSVGTAGSQTSYIYLESNLGKTDNLDSILAYRNDGLGNLTALPGSLSHFRHRGLRSDERPV